MCVYTCMHTHTIVLFIVFQGKGILTFFSSIAVLFDTIILLFTDTVIGLEWNYFLNLYRCEIRICP